MKMSIAPDHQVVCMAHQLAVSLQPVFSDPADKMMTNAERIYVPHCSHIFRPFYMDSYF